MKIFKYEEYTIAQDSKRDFTIVEKNNNFFKLDNATFDSLFGKDYGNGVVLNFCNKGPCEEISVEDVKKELERIEYYIQENDIVLIRTDTDKKWGKPNYFYEAPGMSREATKFLVESGVKIIGIDCYSLDRPFMAMVKQYYRTNDKKCLWPAHFYGREKEYCHIERLTNLDKIPMNYGFKFCCFPIKLKEMGAAWVRAVAIIE